MNFRYFFVNNIHFTPTSVKNILFPKLALYVPKWHAAFLNGISPQCAAYFLFKLHLFRYFKISDKSSFNSTFSMPLDNVIHTDLNYYITNKSSPIDYSQLNGQTPVLKHNFLIINITRNKTIMLKQNTN